MFIWLSAQHISILQIDSVHKLGLLLKILSFPQRQLYQGWKLVQGVIWWLEPPRGLSCLIIILLNTGINNALRRFGPHSATLGAKCHHIALVVIRGNSRTWLEHKSSGHQCFPPCIDPIDCVNSVNLTSDVQAWSYISWLSGSQKILECFDQIKRTHMCWLVFQITKQL